MANEKNNCPINGSKLQDFSTPKKIFIYGSCVSRDALEYAEDGQFSIVEYVARSSLVSSFEEKSFLQKGNQNSLLNDVDFSLIPNNFCRRCVKYDIAKELPNLLREQQFDVLLVDFIAERHDLWKTEHGFVTISWELMQTGIKIPDQEILKSNDLYKLELWKNAWDRFIAFLHAHHLFDKLVINRVYWTAKLSDGRCFTAGDEYEIIINNIILEHMYNYAYKNGVKFINYDDKILLADVNHKWGLCPRHYTKDMYEHTIYCLKNLFKL